MANISTLHSYRCDLDCGATIIRLVKPLMHQDALADEFRAAVYRGDEPVNLAGMAVYGYLLIAATRQTIPLTGTASGSTASVTLPSECYALPGYASLVIQLQSGNVRHTVLKVDLLIQRTGSESILYPESASPTLAELLARIDALEKNGGGSSSGGGIITETDPTVSDWAKRPDPPTYTAQQVGAEPAGTAASAVAAHNADEEAHPAIREAVTELAGRLFALADSDDTTLDQLSEIVAYIKSNKTLIDGITTGKVSVSDIVNNLTSTATNKPLSAAQGKALKALIDAIVVPTKLSDLTGDAAHRLVTDAEKAKWNAKSSFSGAYADLTGKPTIPTKVSQLTNDAGYLTEHQDISGLLPRTELDTAIDTALAKAKASGEFDGKDGADGKDGDDHIAIVTVAEMQAMSQEEWAAEYAKGIRAVLCTDGYTNLVPLSTDESGVVYCGRGYRDNYRLTSSGGMAEAAYMAVSGYIPYTHGSIFRIVGSAGKDALSNGGAYVGVYDASHAVIQIAYMSSLVSAGQATWTARSDGFYELAIDTSKVSAWSSAAYLRASCSCCVGADMIVTADEAIPEVM